MIRTAFTMLLAARRSFPSRDGQPHATLRRVAALFALALPAAAGAGQDGGEQRPRDAAEAVREGDVAQWLKYYERERSAQTPAKQPAHGPEPAAEAKTEDAAPKR